MEKPELSIIIISYNTKEITKDCLNSVLKSLHNSQVKFEVIVVDNNSQDRSKEILNYFKIKFPEKFKIILNSKNLGFGKANNQAVKISSGKYILLLNSDTVTLNNSIEKLFTFYKGNENKNHFIGPKLFNKDMTPQPSAAPFFSLTTVFFALFLRGDYWGLTRYSPNKIRNVGWVSGACILTKKEYFESLGGFDESVFMYMDEVDLLYRAYKKGMNTLFYPYSRFIHIGFASSGSKSYPVIQVFKGLIFFYKKHLPKHKLYYLLFMLKLKAKISILIGKITKNKYLIETYENALKVASMD